LTVVLRRRLVRDRSYSKCIIFGITVLTLTILVILPAFAGGSSALL